MTSPGAAVPKTAAPGDAELEESEVRRSAPQRLLLLLRRLADRPLACRGRLLRALLRRLLLHRHIGLLKLWSSRRRDAPPRDFHYAHKINKCLLRAGNSSPKMEFAAGVGALPKEFVQPARAVYSQMTG